MTGPIDYALMAAYGGLLALALGVIVSLLFRLVYPAKAAKLDRFGSRLDG